MPLGKTRAGLFSTVPSLYPVSQVESALGREAAFELDTKCMIVPLALPPTERRACHQRRTADGRMPKRWTAARWALIAGPLLTHFNG